MSGRPPVHQQFGDAEYTFLLGKVLSGVVAQYLPQIILVSADFDGHCEDFISRVQLTTHWYATITELLKHLAHEACGDRLLFVLEGGYNPVSLEASATGKVFMIHPDDKGCIFMQKINNKHACKIYHHRPRACRGFRCNLADSSFLDLFGADSIRLLGQDRFGLPVMKK